MTDGRDGLEPMASSDPVPAISYELPTARRVVGAGIGLALAATRDLRNASLYVGLLVLAALGPAVVFGVAVVDLLDLDLAALADDIAVRGQLVFFDHPELVSPLLFMELLAGVGIALVVAIGIDAQAIGIAILAGRARHGGRGALADDSGESPISLPEAITRARQVFWRLLGGSFLVGLYTTILEFILHLPFGVDTGSNAALDFVIAFAATIATAPFAYLAAGIVLGDVGPIEALRRSDRLFRARPWIALVVILFTLVTAAIEVFALGAGLELVFGTAEILALDVAPGGLALVLPTIFVLAVITAFGSLMFTISALVAAPQVAAFLGLTFYAGGLDRARAGDPSRPASARWVSRPMAVAFALLAVGTLLGILSVAGQAG